MRGLAEPFEQAASFVQVLLAEYERLDRIKGEYGLTWRGMVMHTAKDLETPADE